MWNKEGIIKDYVAEMWFNTNWEVKVNLLDPGRRRKEIYLVESEWQKRVVKFFKRSLLELFTKEVTRRSTSSFDYAPQLLYYNHKVVSTKPNQVMAGGDFMFFVEEFIAWKTLNEVLRESNGKEIDYVYKALEVYKRVFDTTYSNNFILKNANPNNIIFRNWDIKDPYIIDWTAMKDTIWIPEQTAKDDYEWMLKSNIANIVLQYTK